MKKAVVTGANGFIGMELCKKLDEENVITYAILRSEEKYSEELKRLKLIKPIFCDMNEIEFLSQKINDRSFDAFFHLAWSGVSGAARGDYVEQLNSIKWTLDSIVAAQKLECMKFIGAGTLAEFDSFNYCLCDKSSPNLVSCYGTSKIAAHFMSKALCNNLEIDHLWAYISNTYGENDRSSNFINYASKLILSADEDAKFTSGEQYYDFVHVSDVANGLYQIGNSGISSCAYYIGSEHPKKLKEFIIELRNILNPKKELLLGAIPFNGISAPIETFSCAKLNRDTEYHAKVSFSDGIRRIKEAKGW